MTHSQPASSSADSANNQLRITNLTGQCSMQDLGRNHAQHLGYCASGAADEFAFRWANKLLHNEQNAAALELIFAHIELVIKGNIELVSTGAPSEILLNGKAVKQWQVISVGDGDKLRIAAPKNGLISYLAVKGGFERNRFLASCSQSINERHLENAEATPKAGDMLTVNSPSQLESSVASASCNNTNTAAIAINKQRNISFQRFYQNSPLILRFIASELFLALPENAQRALLQGYKISATSNRMGYRLEGTAFIPQQIEQHKATLSRPVCFGTIQLPPDGQPIVLMKDRQTIGGYPVLGTVIQTDLFRLSQKRPGETVQFLPVSLAQAQAQLHSFLERFS